MSTRIWLTRRRCPAKPEIHQSACSVSRAPTTCIYLRSSFTRDFRHISLFYEAKTSDEKPNSSSLLNRVVQKSLSSPGKMVRSQRKKGIDRKATRLQDNPKELDFGAPDPQLLGDLLLKQTKRFNPDLSLVESEGHRVPGEAWCPIFHLRYLAARFSMFARRLIWF